MCHTKDESVAPAVGHFVLLHKASPLVGLIKHYLLPTKYYNFAVLHNNYECMYEKNVYYSWQ